jgi:hypothetical protein
VPLSNVVSGGAAAGHSIERLDRLRRKLGIVKFTAEDESEMWALSVHAPLDDASADDF